jgi:alpha-tubulin suppressor-like RCC1 family protein
MVCDETSLPGYVDAGAPEATVPDGNAPDAPDGGASDASLDSGDAGATVPDAAPDATAPNDAGSDSAFDGGPIPTAATLISGGENFTCFVRLSRQYNVCWGAGMQGQLGDETYGDSSPSVVAVLGACTSIGTGVAFACAMDESHVWCWGDDSVGQLGQGDAGGPKQDSPLMPVDVPAPIALAVGFDHACPVSKGGQVRCWGYNSARQVSPTAATMILNTSTLVALPGSVDGVAAGALHSCAWSASAGTVWCWGDNSKAQLGSGQTSTDVTMIPQEVMALAGAPILEMRAGAYHTCAVRADNHAVICWGANDSGQILGDMRAGGVTAPVPVGPPSIHVSPGAGHTCVIGTDDTVTCWGSNASGQLGTGLLTGLRAVAIGAGFAHTCALDDAGTVSCWGSNTSGALGVPMVAAGNLVTPALP